VGDCDSVGWYSSRRGIDKDLPSNSLLNMMNDWIENLDVPQKVIWAIGGLGLTAWAAFLRLISIPVKEHAMCSVTGID